MLAKRLMALLSVGLMFGVLSVGDVGLTEVAAQAKKDDKKDPPKKEPPKKDQKDPVKKESEDDSWPKVKGTVAKIIKVDASKKTVDVSMAGKMVSLMVGDEVKFFGPRGGEGDGFKDDRFVAGRNVKIVMDGTKLKEVHLDYRPGKDEKDKK